MKKKEIIEKIKQIAINNNISHFFNTLLEDFLQEDIKEIHQRYLGKALKILKAK